MKFGGDEGDRTPDLMNAIHALSQLSYVPEYRTTIRTPQMPNAYYPLSVIGCLLSLALELRFTLFEKCAYAFFFVLGRETYRKKVDLTAETFVEI